MKIFRPELKKGYLQIRHTCFMLDWGVECEKLSRINLGSPTVDVDYIDIKIHMAQLGKGRIPDFCYVGSHPIVSDRVKNLLFADQGVEFIPTRLVGARLEKRPGLVTDISIQDSGLVVDREFYVLNVSAFSNCLDSENTTMSKEFISPDIAAKPGVYLSVVFEKEPSSQVFSLPGKPYGLLVAETFVASCEQHKIKGLGVVEIMDTTIANELNMYPTDTSNLVSMTEAYRLYDQMH